uniref:Uncharacterized protein n=1 Tax=uncultured Armatimonadetes bacterium TaxID=157466 RepID=A0A6J4JT58_9BACT|nr:hypothetical protein AVDCRST_MAG63-3997 [uncultured Armatimonadetes bacterium]
MTRQKRDDILLFVAAPRGRGVHLQTGAGQSRAWGEAPRTLERVARFRFAAALPAPRKDLSAIS